jgi:hypothetical protein
VKNKFTIRIGDNDSNYDTANIVFTIENSTYAHGTIAVYTNGNDGLFLDKLNVESLVCENSWESNKKIEILSNKSSLFTEKFDRVFRTVYTVEDPKRSINGPSKWLYAKNIYGREVVLYQTSKIRDQGEDTDTSKSILNGVSVGCSTSINYEFRGNHDGIVGVVFKYKDNDNFFTFEVGGSDEMKNRFFQLRKKFEGKWSTISRFNSNQEVPYLPFFGYELGTWYGVSVQINCPFIRVSVGLIGVTKKIQIMEVEDSTLADGKMGFSISGTVAAFAEINLSPSEIPYCNIKIIIFS